MWTFTQPDAVALCIFDSPDQLSPDGPVTHLERTLNPPRQRRRTWERLGAGHVKNEQDWPHRLEDHNRLRSNLDLTVEISTPSAGGRDKSSARHLNVDQHRVERRVEAKAADELHQFEVGCARIELASILEKLVQRTTDRLSTRWLSSVSLSQDGLSPSGVLG